MKKTFYGLGFQEQLELPSKKYAQETSSRLGVTLIPLAEEEKPDHFKHVDVYNVGGMPDMMIAFYPRKADNGTSYLCFAVEKPEKTNLALTDIVDMYHLSDYTSFVEGVFGSLKPGETSISNIRPLGEILDSLANPNLYK